MEETAVCIIANNLYYQTRYCIENLLAKTKMKVKIYVFDNGTTDERLREYFEKNSKENGWYLNRSETVVSLAEAHSSLLKTFTQKYGCILPVNFLVNSGWLEELLVSVKSCEKAGILSIRSGDENVFIMPLLHHSLTSEDYLSNVWFTENNAVDGLFFFKKEILEKTGLFDTKLNAPGYEKAEFCFRFSANGYRNYYIRKQTALKINTQNEILFPTKTIEGLAAIKESIERMVENRTYKK